MKNDSQQEERLVWRLKEKQILYDRRWLNTGPGLISWRTEPSLSPIM